MRFFVSTQAIVLSTKSSTCTSQYVFTVRHFVNIADTAVEIADTAVEIADTAKVNNPIALLNFLCAENSELCLFVCLFVCLN